MGLTQTPTSAKINVFIRIFWNTKIGNNVSLSGLSLEDLTRRVDFVGTSASRIGIEDGQLIGSVDAFTDNADGLRNSKRVGRNGTKDETSGIFQIPIFTNNGDASRNQNWRLLWEIQFAPNFVGLFGFGGT